MSGDGFTAEHDGLHRLHTAERGQLDVCHIAITTPQFNQCWTLDPTGNWQGFRQDDDGSGTWDLIQARTANPVNEITGIDNTTGASWATPTYDANGNTTSLPRPDLGADKSTATIWDAWNRPVRFRDPDTDHTLAEFGYDARNFRVLHRPFAAGVLGDTRHYYFTDRWQAIEERLGSSTAPERQHIWGLRYIDDLLLRDRAPSGSGALDERLYFLADANWNITAAVDAAGAVQERIEYTPYGLPQFLSSSFGNRATSQFDIRYSYTGREWLPELALYYFRNRWYSPSLGVFISRDPIGYEGSKWNLHEYVSSNPCINLDPSGEAIPIAVVAAIAATCGGSAVFAGVGAGFCAAAANDAGPILFGTGFAHRIHDDFGTVFARAIIPQRAFRQFDTSPTSQCANRSPNVADQQNQMR